MILNVILVVYAFSVLKALVYSNTQLPHSLPVTILYSPLYQIDSAPFRQQPDTHLPGSDHVLLTDKTIGEGSHRIEHRLLKVIRYVDLQILEFQVYGAGLDDLL